MIEELIGKHVIGKSDFREMMIKGVLRKVVGDTAYVQRTTKSGALHKVPSKYAVLADTVTADPDFPND